MFSTISGLSASLLLFSEHGAYVVIPRITDELKRPKPTGQKESYPLRLQPPFRTC